MSFSISGLSLAYVLPSLDKPQPNISLPSFGVAPTPTEQTRQSQSIKLPQFNALDPVSYFEEVCKPEYKRVIYLNELIEILLDCAEVLEADKQSKLIAIFIKGLEDRGDTPNGGIFRKYTLSPILDFYDAPVMDTVVKEVSIRLAKRMAESIQKNAEGLPDVSIQMPISGGVTLFQNPSEKFNKNATIVDLQEYIKRQGEDKQVKDFIAYLKETNFPEGMTNEEAKLKCVNEFVNKQDNRAEIFSAWGFTSKTRNLVSFEKIFTASLSNSVSVMAKVNELNVESTNKRGEWIFNFLKDRYTNA